MNFPTFPFPGLCSLEVYVGQLFLKRRKKRIQGSPTGSGWGLDLRPWTKFRAEENKSFTLSTPLARADGFSSLHTCFTLWDLLPFQVRVSSVWGLWLNGPFKEIRSSSSKLPMEGEFRCPARSVPNTHLSARENKHAETHVNSRGADSLHFVNHVLYLSLWG